MERGEPGKRSEFVRICSGAALVLVAALALAGPLRNPSLPTLEDFGQYYMAGAITLEGNWEALYPVPRPGAPLNAGWRDGSTMKPANSALAERLGVGDANRYILPPPLAPLFAPLALLPYRPASWIWMALLVLCGWGVAVQAGRLHELAAGRASRLTGIIILVVAISPLLRRSIRTGQLSPLIALCFGCALIAFVRHQDLRGGAAIALGGTAKILPGVLVALAIILRRRVMLGWFAGLAGGGFFVSIVLMGWEVHREFFIEIAPTLRESSPWRGNQSLAGMLLRVMDAERLAPGLALALTAGGFLLLAGACLLIVRRRTEISDSPSTCMAAAASLILPLLMFGPIAWEHYYVYLCPLWGWLAWEAGRSRWSAIPAWGAIALTWAPLAIAPWLKLREPLLSHMLAGAVLMLGLAFIRLMRPRPA